MSKRVSRVAIAVLISLVVIVAVFTSVQAWGGVVRKGEASMPVNNRALGKPSMNVLEPQYFNGSMDSGHDCGSDPTVDY